MDESQQGKRKRVVTACDTCRKSKIKCDGELPQCSRCARMKIVCVYTPIVRKSVPPKRTKLIEGLEDRLNRIESLVMSDLVSESLDTKAGDWQNATYSSNDPNGGTIASTRSYPARPATTPHSAKKASLSRTNDTATPHSETSVLSTSTMEKNPMDFVTTDIRGQSQYIGSASGFSIFSPNGIAWVNEKAGDSQFMSVISSSKCDEPAWSQPHIFAGCSAKQVHRRLPPKEETRALLLEYFRQSAHLWQIFHADTFMPLFETRYAPEYDEVHGPGWWASLNIVLAATHQLRVLYDLTLQDEEELSWLYFRNAMTFLTDLLLQGPHILNVQALLAMAIYSQGASNLELSLFLSSAAVRISQNMGMHRESSGAEMISCVSQERRRVFWVAYIIDKNISLRYGRPPSQDDDDMDVQLPGDEAASATFAEKSMNCLFTDMFRARCMLAKIEGKVYKRLYSVQASRESVEEIVNTVDQLDQELGHWRQNVTDEFRPESEIRVSDDALRLQIVDFHLAYYHCLAAIHRKLVQHGHWLSRLDPLVEDSDKEKIRQRVFSSAVLCVSAARASINLIRFIPQGNLSCIWIMLCYVVMSFLALCANIYQNPEGPKATLDLKLMRIVINFLSLLNNDETGGAAHQLLRICAEFERLAQRAVKKAHEKQALDVSQKQSPVESWPSHRQSTTASTSGTTPTNGIPPDTPASISGGCLPDNRMTQESAGYSDFVVPGSTAQSQRSLFDPEYAEASQSTRIGAEIDFIDGTVLPEYTGPPASSDIWQLPMPLEWNWADMNASYFPAD